MSNVLIASDIHIHPHKKSLERLDHCLEALEWVFKTAKSNCIDEIIFAGDLFHDRQKIDVLVYHKTFEVMNKYLSDGRTRFYSLLGNHDLWHYQKWDINSVRPLASLPGVEVIDRPDTKTIGGGTFDFLPFTHEPIDWLEKFKPIPPGRTLIAHLAVDGAKLNTFFNTKAEVNVEHDGEMVRVDASVFDGWDQTFLGHYHGEQKLRDNVEYIGSPLELSFGEAFQEKHLIIYNPITKTKKYVVNDFSPKHLIIKQKDLEKYDLKNNFVRVIVDDITTTDLVEMRNELTQNNKLGSLEIKPIDKEEEKHIIEDAKAILYQEEKMLERYIQEVGAGELDPTRLLEIGKLICSLELPKEESDE